MIILTNFEIKKILHKKFEFTIAGFPVTPSPGMQIPASTPMQLIKAFGDKAGFEDAVHALQNELYQDIA